ncbi:MAG: exodeoxyribonuclease VII small subunit [Ruminococcus sp.]|nr:exodeoxyribonuclease VII small subunit [Ruminococcus sp.]
MSFETKIERLEQILSVLEDGKLPLDEMVNLYGEGMKLSLECREELENAKLKITSGGEDSGKDI